MVEELWRGEKRRGVKWFAAADEHCRPQAGLVSRGPLQEAVINYLCPQIVLRWLACYDPYLSHAAAAATCEPTESLSYPACALGALVHDNVIYGHPMLLGSSISRQTQPWLTPSLSSDVVSPHSGLFMTGRRHGRALGGKNSTGDPAFTHC